MHTEILQHKIEYWLDDDTNTEVLDDSDIEHIENMIKEGYNEGELNHLDRQKAYGQQEVRGWWKIIK